MGELPPGDHPTPSRFVLRNRVIAALTRGTVVVEAALPQRLAGHRAARRSGWAGSRWGCPGPATSGLSAGVHELLRGEAMLVTDAAEVIELVGDMGELAPDRRGPVLPRDLLDRRTRTGAGRAAGAGRRRWTRSPAGAGPPTDDAVGRLYELRALGFVERHGDGWQLTRQAMITVRSRTRRSLT